MKRKRKLVWLLVSGGMVAVVATSFVISVNVLYRRYRACERKAFAELQGVRNVLLRFSHFKEKIDFSSVNLQKAMESLVQGSNQGEWYFRNDSKEEAVQYIFAVTAESYEMGYYLVLDESLDVLPEESTKVPMVTLRFGLFPKIGQVPIPEDLDLRRLKAHHSEWPGWLECFIMDEDPVRMGI